MTPRTLDTFDNLTTTFANVVDIPTWLLTDPTVKARSTVRRRRHLVWWLVVKEQIPVNDVADRFGMSRVTVWRAVGNHRRTTRDPNPWTKECARVEQTIRELLTS